METIENNGIKTEGFLMSWIFTLYSRAFNLKVVRAVWDMIFVFGEFTIIQVGIAIFKLIQEDLTMSNLNFGFNMIRRITNKIMMKNLAKEVTKKFMENEKLNEIMIDISFCENFEDKILEILDKNFDYQASAIRSLQNFKNSFQNSNKNRDLFKKMKTSKKIRIDDDSDEEDEEIIWD